MAYSIGEISRLTGVSVSALRYYDKLGLLPPVERTEGNIRQFDDFVLEWLDTMDCLKKSGMTLKQIQQYASWCVSGDETFEKRLGIFIQQKEATLHQMAELQETLAHLEHKEEYFRCLVEGKEPPPCKRHRER